MTGDDDRLARLQRRREALAELSDAELKERFWQLCHEVTAPIVELARTHTTPSIERSVLLRMGIDSLSSQGVVERIHQAGLLGRGAGQVLLEVAAERNTDVRGAARAILADADVLRPLARSARA
jgi:D-ornithine 4,5-aminomutase subunit alpha